MSNKAKERKVEILAPAGSMDSLRAAIGAGADAVYMGGSRFGARAFADNPDREGMLAAIDYAHIHGRKLYMTVNTLLREDEMGEELRNYLKPYYEEGLDAVIVQDAGVIEFVSDEFPGLPIHASTQMSLTMAEGARCFENTPVTRLVNARELGLCELRRLRENTALEIESFVHGALCYCYSGQCLMSSMIGGRSGNRGRCAQPCRMEYQTIPEQETNGSYLLSPKDICTLDMVPELVEAGIDSFKIEGRMKRYEYAAGVAAAYRTEVDRYLELGRERYEAFHREHPEVLRQAMQELQDLYNRGGFSGGYYHCHNGRSMMSMIRPNHSGVYVGDVAEVKKNRAVIRNKERLKAQDILEIRRKSANSEKVVYEFTLGQDYDANGKLETNFTPGRKVCAGDPVYRTRNQQLLSEISSRYYDTEPQIGIDGVFTAKVGEPAELTLYLNRAQTEQLTVTVRGDITQAALKQPVSGDKIRAQLMKTGDTFFVFHKLDICLKGEVFIPVSRLNELRRQAIKELEAEIVRTKKRGYRNEPKKAAFCDEGNMDNKLIENREATGDFPRDTVSQSFTQTGISASVLSEDQLCAVFADGRVTRVYYDISVLPAEKIAEHAAAAKAKRVEFFIRMPAVCRAATYDWLNSRRELLLDENVAGFLIQNYEELYLVAHEWAQHLNGRMIQADGKLYTMNRMAKQWFTKQGVSRFTASYEENRTQLQKLGVQDMELIVYGRIPLMVSAQCVRRNKADCLLEKAEGRDAGAVPVMYIRDRKQKVLPVQQCCRFCYNIIYSAQCLNLTDCKEELRELSPCMLRYDFTFESGQQAAQILKGNMDLMHEEWTHGHFHRGVQ